MRSAIIQNMKKRDCSYTECCILSSVQSKSSDAVLVLWTRAVEDTGMASGTGKFLRFSLGGFCTSEFLRCVLQLCFLQTNSFNHY